jgi:hypothetical protein
VNIESSFDPVTGKESATNNPPPNVVKLSASWEDKPSAEHRWLSEAEAGKIASTLLSQRLNLMQLVPHKFTD